MASLIEFKTWPKHQHLYYEITSSGLSFWVKSYSKATVGLAAKPSKGCAYEIILQRDSCHMMANNYNVMKREVSSPTNINNILSGNEFRKFWITWKNNSIAFGTGYTVLLWRQCTVKHLKYVTFYVSDDTRQCAEWRCYLPPVIENLPLKQIQGTELHWVQVEDQLPDGALIGGYENEFLYIIRAPFRGSLTPGKFVPSLGLGFISWGGDSQECDTLEILCGDNCIWVPSKDDQIPAGALEAGFTEVINETMYVGRVHYRGHLIVGKIAPSHKCCYFPYEDRELSAQDYEVLVVPNPKVRIPFVSTELHDNFVDPIGVHELSDGDEVFDDYL
ncbi:unnamed protein product, partial [Brenthis ino]